MWWKDLKKISRSGNQLGWFDKNISWQIGKGTKFIFWENRWNEDISLKDKFLKLYKKILVISLLMCQIWKYESTIDGN